LSSPASSPAVEFMRPVSHRRLQPAGPLA
jgi:hypothetical protein